VAKILCQENHDGMCICWGEFYNEHVCSPKCESTFRENFGKEEKEDDDENFLM
jgi:hypothetical protein